MKKGMFISFEGGEGCGKSTHIKSLQNYFESLGVACILVREPGSTAISEEIRNILLHKKSFGNMDSKTELLLFAASRAQLVEEVIRPALKEGKVVISDRFYDSTIAYQGAARALNMDSVKFINDFAVGDIMPDLTILLDIDTKVGLQRASERDSNNTDRMGSEKIEFYEKVRNCFLDLAKKYSSRFRIIDTSKSKEETSAQIIEAVKNF